MAKARVLEFDSLVAAQISVVLFICKLFVARWWGEDICACVSTIQATRTCGYRDVYEDASS